MRALTLAAVLLAGPTPLLAQSTGHPGVSRGASGGPDSAAVLAVVHRVFDAMRSRDSAALRATFATGAQMISTGSRNGAAVVEVESPDGFIAAVGKPSDATWDERIYHPEVRLDGDLATVWAEYDFYLGGKFSHCGVDTFILGRTADGWKIASVADTRRREGCPQR